ncbi:gluconolactonase [Diaporthe helianthi]|uniref:Gluconolactonase n=1 Tax=Diaporthe helianthi TaxID=158607 RepID=A0A2P5HXX6_DIAHE|nr:gluconolactonase [Diaporthe helianthi]
MPGLTKAAALAAALGSQAFAQRTKFTLTHPDLANFTVYDDSFYDVIGASASIELLYNATEPLFHEGAVYVAAADTLFVSSNRIPLPDGQTDDSTSNQMIKLSAVTNVSAPMTQGGGPGSPITVQPVDTSSIVLPNGGVLNTGPRGEQNGIIFTAQGSKTKPGGLFSIPDPVGNPNVSVPLVTSFMGRPFNSLNDVAVLSEIDGETFWFTDPSYGASQGIRDPPQLPNQVYRFDTATNTTRVVADGFQQPNGLAFSLDFNVLYVTDGSASSDNPAGTATIYKYDLAYNQPGTFLANRTVFAFAPEGIPDGIKVDQKGNVWCGTGSGVSVFNNIGELIGEITVKGGASNFGSATFGAFNGERTIFVLGETLLWRVKLWIETGVASS